MTKQSIAEILREHAARYPKMQPQDAVKLLYQANFGPGHLVKDIENATARIVLEQKDALPVPAITVEDIGHGFARVYLTKDTSAEDLAELFARSAEEQCGDRDGFEADLAVLRKITEEGTFGFDADELETYLAKYIEAGMPMVSHTDEYKKAYTPAYRVVLRELLAE